MRAIRITYLILILLWIFNIPVIGQSYVESSVLASGSWYKIKVSKPGMVKITYDEIESMGFAPGSAPAIYANNYGLLSYINNDTAPDDLLPLPMYIEKGADNIFNSGDYLLFYSDDTHRWIYNNTDTYKFQRHYYSDTASYFISNSQTAYEISEQSESLSADYTSRYYDYLINHELEKDNIIKSGREWYEPVSSNQDLDLTYLLPGDQYEPGEAAKYKLRVLARSSIMSSFRLVSEANILSSIPISEVNLFNTAGTFARSEQIVSEYNIFDNTNDLRLQFFNNGNNSAKAWIDFLQLHLRLKSAYNGSELVLRDYKSMGSGRITEFVVESNDDNLQVWDISNSSEPIKIPGVYSSGELKFIAKTDSLVTFIVFDPDKVAGEKQIYGPINNQNLHSPEMIDMIIIAPTVFLGKAHELAEIHYEDEGLISRVVSLNQIYNEFSGGIPDISAIRNYVRMVYTRNKESDKPLKFLTLFGDGSYENKTLPPLNPNFIPTYQTQNSNVTILSFTSDDYYGLLDPGEGESEGFLDIGIGRLPVSDTTEANTVLNKIRSYIAPENMGPWRNNILMIADDEDSNAHINDAESLSDQVEQNNPSFNIDKVYLDSYLQVSSINGASYPDATEDINSSINSGCLIVNYLGHGSEKGLAHERVVKVEDINLWSNFNSLPVFITATCEFSRFDDIDIEQGSGEISEITSAGEKVLLSPKGGGIALLTTTRIVYSAPNYILNSKIYQNAFNLDGNMEGLALGEIVRLAKINAGSGDNKRNFTLLGDPAVRLAHPWHGKIRTDSINGVDITVFTDTINALSELRLSGHLETSDGELLTGLNGIINVTIFDKKYNISTLANDGGNVYEFTKQDRILFNGKAEVKNGLFNVLSFIPRDIDYSYNNGKISYYAQSGDIDFGGYTEDIIIGGFNNLSNNDTTGPSIRLFMNDTLFRSGGITDRWPTLLANISDPSGINTAGVGIGHDVVFYLDNDRSNTIVLNNFFENEINSYTTGSLSYDLNEVIRGKHTLSLRAWDNFNNSSTETLVFIIETDKGFILNDLINYPNPVINDTRISLGHNRPGINLEIEILIFSSNGRIVKKIYKQQITNGYAINPIIWNGLDERGSKVARGIYIYKVIIKTQTGEKASDSGRMIIL